MPSLPDNIAAVLTAVHERDQVPVDDARVMHRHSNTAVALPAAGRLVRIAGNPDAHDRVAISVRATRWLAGRGYPCVVPCGAPFLVDGQVVSMWRLLDVSDGPPATGAELGELLRALHHQPAPPADLHLPTLSDPFDSVASAIRHHPGGMADEDRQWLQSRITVLREAWADLPTVLARGLIHGDSHSNNVIRTKDGVVLADWDHVSLGPREWDVIQPFYMARRFGRHSDADLLQFTSAYGWDARHWPGFETLIQVREITGLSPYVRKAPTQSWARAEVAHRLETLRTRKVTARWNSPRRS
ncbi:MULTISPECIES: phosphotransferase family protein [Actinomadura]|uniref:Phosphotransferase family protein n=2 Tax=Actinomadura yumaensis TaxID=111807 RepID=A0ABW2CW12_9ACTN|nr:aminoglycoside phosphotransferase family protein [Actinomadura sp. J1-007]